MLRALLVLPLVLALAPCAPANPYPKEAAVPKDPAAFFASRGAAFKVVDGADLRRTARDVMRVRFDWREATDTFVLAASVIEPSGTDAIIARSRHEDELGSFKVQLVDIATGTVIAYDAIGTGQEFRKLTRSLSFRLPVPTAPAEMRLIAENPRTGVMEQVLTTTIDPATLTHFEPAAVDVRVLRAASVQPSLILNVYAEGYVAGSATRFFQDAARVATALEQGDFPLQERFEIRGVFAPSRQAIGRARDLGMPVPERDSFLGLYFPYWRNFGRWYHVLYPTREERFRAALATAAYDYALAIVDDTAYWGVGNFRELTAIPARHPSFSYLLLHEIGHFFGLNEEYEGGGATELAFAPEIFEPWSQNITFLHDPASLKWRHLVGASTPLPTPESRWRTGLYGAYPGGYADSEPFGESHKPGLECTMNSDSNFCEICRQALERRVRFDLGELLGHAENGSRSNDVLDHRHFRRR